MAQLPQTGTLEQVLRCLKALAQSPAFSIEMQVVAGEMGAGAFQPGNFADANGATFALSLDDEEFGPPATWLKDAFAAVVTSDAVSPSPPYPRMHLIGLAGRAESASTGTFVVDQQEQVAGWVYTVDSIVVAANDRAVLAERHAYALADAWERLVRRNPNLGGLVQLISSEVPPSAGGAVSTARSGNVAGILQRFQVYTIRTYLG